MNGASLRRTLRRGGVVVGTSVFEFGAPGTARALAVAGVDLVFYDMEHTGLGIDTIRMPMAAARAVDQVALARPPANLSHLIGPILDSGAHGIIAPMLETADEAARPGARA
jgi:2-keto-3-deoxy-L-rhamnonate aldolase RhmA